MSLLSKLKRLTGRSPEPAPPDPLAELDAVIAKLEHARAEAKKVLIHHQSGDRSALQEAVRRVEAKLDEAQAKRKILAARVARVQRVKELTLEMREINAEAKRVHDTGGSDDRIAELRKRAAEIDVEAAELRQTREGDET